MTYKLIFSHLIENFPFDVFESLILLPHSTCNPSSLVLPLLKFRSLYFFFIFIIYLHGCFARCVCLPSAHLPSKARRRHWMCWGWSCSLCELSYGCWELNPSPGRATSALDHGAIYSVPGHCIFHWPFPPPDDSQRVLHILPNMISWPVIFS